MRIEKAMKAIIMVVILSAVVSCQPQQKPSAGIPVTPEMLESVSQSLAQSASATESTEEDDVNVTVEWIDESLETEHDSLTDVVYWTESGSVYHVTDQCSSLKHSEKILHGSVEEALAAKKERPCKTCS